MKRITYVLLLIAWKQSKLSILFILHVTDNINVYICVLNATENKEEEEGKKNTQKVAEVL